MGLFQETRQKINYKLLEAAREHESMATVINTNNSTDLTSHTRNIKQHNLVMAALLKMMAGNGLIDQFLDHFSVDQNK